jgi:penicillin amidase
LDGYRQGRIVEALSARDDWRLQDVGALQLDQFSLLWRELRDTLLATPVETAAAQQALALLNGWDGVVGAHSPAASIFELWIAEMARRLLVAKAPRTAEWAAREGPLHLVARPAISLRRLGHLARLIREQPPGWFESSWAREMADALSAAVGILREQRGANPERWSWGDLRPLLLRHAVGGHKLLAPVYNLGPFPWGGDACTVAQASVDLACPTIPAFGVATLRMVVDVGEWERSRFVLPSGQSGNPLSPHYADQHDLWRRGEGIPIAWSAERVAAAARTTLRLMPVERAAD